MLWVRTLCIPLYPPSGGVDARDDISSLEEVLYERKRLSFKEHMCVGAGGCATGELRRKEAKSKQPRLVPKKVNSTVDLLTSRFLVCSICMYYVQRNNHE